MLYQAYQFQVDMVAPVRALAAAALQGFRQMDPRLAQTCGVRNLTAAYELVARAGLTHERPPFGITETLVGRKVVGVEEQIVDVTPFGSLLHFAKTTPLEQPRVLLVAPLSGHFATLLRGTVKTLLPEQDVYITDWHNARDVSVDAGRFGFDEYIEHLIRWLDLLGPGMHVMAVCQPCVAALAATAVMAQAGDPAQPRTLTLMAGPIDARVDPTVVNDLATSRPLAWFERSVITSVPLRYAGAGRRVYPGFLQVAAFVSMNAGRHLEAHRLLFHELASGDAVGAAATKAFYDEYFAVSDLTAEFYLETVQYVFQEHRLARGVLEYQGRPVDPGAIRRCALFTVEGERDDICSPGQTFPAHDLCRNIKPYQKQHRLQPGVGHYGVFSGRRWETQIYPLVNNLILANN